MRRIVVDSDDAAREGGLVTVDGVLEKGEDKLSRKAYWKIETIGGRKFCFESGEQRAAFLIALPPSMGIVISNASRGRK